jgi:hypothetical protein
MSWMALAEDLMAVYANVRAVRSGGESTVSESLSTDCGGFHGHHLTCLAAVMPLLVGSTDRQPRDDCTAKRNLLEGSDIL